MIIYGHRGAMGEAPENTLSGFELAYRHGIRHFELDIRLSADGELIVIHDPTLERTTGRKGKPSDYTAAELAEIDARKNVKPWSEFQGIPRLTDILEAVPETVHFQFEVKTDYKDRLNILCNRLVELIQRRQFHGRCAITSSNTWVLREVKRRDDTIATGFVAENRFPNPVDTAIKHGCSYLCINWPLVNRALVVNAQAKSLHVSCWTVNRIHDILELEKAGVDSVITNFPNSTLTYFDNRTKLQVPHPVE
ncbi:MAG: glycerophosphodiester phosphodiesterase [Pseudomonadales bacterium]|nr:glycerophosphodiester phosphodiesterase [Pseudomonadales bacterium]